MTMEPGVILERVKATAVPAEDPYLKEGLVRPNSFQRTYTGMMLAAGMFGTLLPPIVVFGGVLLAREWAFKGSLSSYYHSGMRDVFVGMLCIVGFFLVVYKLFEWKSDNIFSIGAGIGAATLALFPTRLGEGISKDELTPLQSRVGENLTFYIHIGATSLFFTCLVIICFGFAIQERQRNQERKAGKSKYPPQFWFGFHLAAVGVMIGSLVFILTAWFVERQGWYDGFIITYATLFGESAAIFAFGLSWWTKGSEFPKLRAVDPATGEQVVVNPQVDAAPSAALEAQPPVDVVLKPSDS
ncbi:MAG TPA: hypothetical protein VFV93_01945 [Thermomicrobiales bacterium]|nr:hypothetical protein [Thermomicrobiales bacterium]